MSKNKIAFQGELGAYSHIAVKEVFTNVEIKTCSTFEESFKTAHEDETYKILIPLENSLAGRVADIHYLLPKYKLQIHGEHFQTVEHNLLARPEAEIKDIKFVRSHAQAIGQCQKIIMENNYKTIISADTAGSAQELAESSDKSVAAIASELSADIYKLKILKNPKRPSCRTIAPASVTRLHLVARLRQQVSHDCAYKYHKPKSKYKKHRLRKATF